MSHSLTLRRFHLSPRFLAAGWCLLATLGQAATVNFTQNSRDDATGSLISAVSSSQYLESGVTYSTVTAPVTSGSYRFTHWTNSSYPATVYRDAWGRSQNPISFVLLEDTTATAHYLPATRDTDGDGVPDWYEIEYYGDLSRSASYDGDGDGITLAAEYSGGTHPLYGNASQAGGVSYTDSGMVTCNLAGYASYVLRSVPAGTVNQTTIAPPGTVVTTPDLSANISFGYWTLDGARQQDAWGVALRQFTFTVDGADRVAVASLFTNDSDGDGINDGYEQYYFGTLANGASSDTDGDGISLLAEFTGGTSPLYGKSHQDGGVAWADSAMVVINLQPYERLSKMLVGGVLTDFFSPDPGVVTGIQAGTWSATAVTDWDGDGDLDLFVANENGLRVFRNIGTARNPNFEEITSGFAGLAAFVASIDRPSLAGGDWNGDGFGDLVIGGNTGTLRLIASGGTFTSNGSGAEISVGSSNARPALGDMNGDGKADLIVLLDDGTARLYPNNGASMPFAGPGTSNYLGVDAPAGTSITTGDINQDGLPDVLLADSDGRIWEFLRNGDGSFTLKSKVWGGSYPGFAAGLTLAALDLESDGDLDLIGGLANGGVICLRDPSVGRPTGLIATPGATSIRLDWNADWQSRIKGYNVYRSDTGTGPWTLLTALPALSPPYLDTSVAPVTNYFYTVTGLTQAYYPGNSVPKVVESLAAEPVSASTGQVTLTVRPAHVRSGVIVKVLISIDNPIGLVGAGMDIKIAYDPSKLRPAAQVDASRPTVELSGLGSNLVTTDNGATATGELEIIGVSGAMVAGRGTFFTLNLQVAATVPNGAVLGVTITSAVLKDINGNTVAVNLPPAARVDVAPDYQHGDLTGNGVVDEADKDLLKALIMPQARPPTANEQAAGDLNGDGQLDEKDLTQLMRQLEGLP